MIQTTNKPEPAEAPQAAPGALGVSAERLTRIRPVMQAHVERRGFSGISTLLAREGEVVHFEQVGWQDRERQRPLGQDSIFRLYSMTKPIICTAFMTLYEEGRFGLLDPLEMFLPDFGKLRVLTGTTLKDAHEEALLRPITLRDLLTHTAGFTYDIYDDVAVSALYRESHLFADAGRSLEEMIAALAQLPLAFQPGSRWHYSVSIDVVARLIEVISGQPLQQFLQARLFGPLGMRDTGFVVPPEKRERVATVYGHGQLDPARATLSGLAEAWQQRAQEPLELSASYPVADEGFARGGFGLFSTAQDFFAFAQMLLNRGSSNGARILAPKTVDFMHMNHLPPALLPYAFAGAPCSGYGFGLGSRVLLDVAASGMVGSVGEYGGNGAAKTYYWVDPQEELVGILMAQYMAAPHTPERDFQVLAYQALLA